MKKLLYGPMLLMLALTACAPQTPTEPPSFIIEQPDQGDSSTGGELSSIEYAVVKRLSENLDLNINDVVVLENRSTDFSDACLGVSMPEVMCAQVVTPGHVIVLEANELQYEYHTNEDGTQIQPATLALTWSRDGGFAGFCDRLTVFLSGEVYGSQCSPQDEKTGTFASLMQEQEQEQFFEWVVRYREMTLDASDPKGVADGMTVVLKFSGMGKSKPGKPVEQEMFLWAQELFQKLYE